MAAIDAKAINIHMQVTGPFAAQIARNGAAVQTFGSQAHAGMAKAQSGMARFGATAAKVGKFSAVAIAAGLVLSAKAAIDFESSFAGIRKTVDTSEAGFVRLAMGIRQMATEIPIGVNELNRIAELGGQLGVDAGGLLEFTETIALIGVTTTLATEEASLGFARLDNIMQLNGKSFDKIGSTIVDLGNNFAATEDEILRFSLRVAPIGKTVGLTTDEVLALATAFTSVGIPAERGGTAVQKSFIKMADAVDQGGEKLSIFAETAGMTSEAFAKLFKQDPAAAFDAFVQGLASVEDSGRSVFGVLDAVGLGNQRVITSLLAMGNAGDVLTEALLRSESAWADNLALTEEAEKRFETTASQLKVLKNNIVDAGIAIGTELLPFIGDLAAGFKTILDWIVELPGPVKGAVAAIGALSGALLLLATSHPILAGLTLVAGAIALIGNRAKDSAAWVKLLQDISERGFAEGDDFEALFGPNLLGDLKNAGLRDEDINKLLFGTQSDIDKINSQLQAYWVSSTGDTYESPIIGLVGQVRDDLKTETNKLQGDVAAQNKLKILGLDFLIPGGEEARAASDQARSTVQSIYRARQGLTDLDPVELRPAVLSPETRDDISEAIDDYRDTITEGFAEVDEAVRSQIDLWYQFDDELEIAWDDIISTLARQITAVGDFEQVLSNLDFTPGMESLIRDTFNTPALKEAFVEFARTGGEEFDTWFAQLTTEADRLTRLVMSIYRGMQTELDFTNGEKFLASITAISDQIIADSGGALNPYQVWLGVLQATIEDAEPGMKRRITDLILSSLADGGQLSESINLTKAQIDELIAKLVEFSGVYTAKVVLSGALSGAYDIPTNIPTGGDFVYEPRALGGNVFANKPYMVGEVGPELFVPFNSGTIVPNKDLGGETKNEYNLEVNGSTNPSADGETLLLTAQLVGSI